MIDFKNKSIIKLKQINSDIAAKEIEPLLINGESIIGVYQSMRDYVVFTTKRIISVNVQGITGKKKDFTSLPYSKVQVFSIETAGTFDLDSELDLFFAGMGQVRFEFGKSSDIIQIGQIIANYAL